ncbi:uncharacterized protein LOC119445113 [Dermacentor silvarum]|uniref:uncharacterized protein LOC119445113 n=1 Tax=Dermacentor silvarum TaxID=543639 RepID=UPI0018978467|nr:uncharacterized protein LOC119445113 [Dermacentor silvarum]
MAACPEQEIDGILSTDLRSNFPVSPAPIPNSEVISKHSRTRERSLSKKVSNNERDINQLSDDAFESVLRELVECKPQARSSSLVRSLRREVRDQEELFDGSLHALPLLSSSASGGHHQPRHHHRPGGSVSLQDLASSSPMPSSSMVRPRGGGVPNPAGRGMRQVNASRLADARTARLDHHIEVATAAATAAAANSNTGSGNSSGSEASRADEEKPSAAVAALGRVDEPSCAIKFPLLVRPGKTPQPDQELVTIKNGSSMAMNDDTAELPAPLDHWPPPGHHCSHRPQPHHVHCCKGILHGQGRQDVLLWRHFDNTVHTPRERPTPKQQREKCIAVPFAGTAPSCHPRWVRSIRDRGALGHMLMTVVLLRLNQWPWQLGILAHCDTGTVTAIAQSRIRDGELHSNNGSYSARKSKRSRNHVDPTVMAEQMTGHRGSDSIDTLLAYIYSDDKSGAPNSSNNGGNSMSTENRKGKNMRKGATSSSSNSSGAKNSLSSPPPGQADEKEVVHEGLSEDVINNNFDSSHRRAVFEDAPLCGGGSGGSPNEKERSFSPSFYSDYGTETELTGSYRVDLSSYSDVDQIQESEFRLVTKKQRRRAQLKKAATTVYEGFHRPLGGGGGTAMEFGSSQGTAITSATGNGPVEDSTVRRPGVHSLESLSQPQQQQLQQQRNSVGAASIRQEPPATVAGGGRQHNYTGSAPPSEPSSPENSDLDSVHSLPVSSGSGVAATTVLQTSYADIARMSCRQGRGGTSSNGGGGGGGAAAANLSAGAENPAAVVVPLQQTAVRPTSQGTEALAVAMTSAVAPTAGGLATMTVSAGSARENVSSSSTECYQSGEGDRSSSPAVVLLDDIGGTPPTTLGEITFGFDVNEQLVQMSLNSQFQCVPSGGTLGEGGEPAATAPAAAAVMAPPRFDGRPEELGRFNHRDVVDFLDWEWVRAYQSYEKEGSSDSKTRVLYYCDSSSSGGQQQQNS